MSKHYSLTALAAIVFFTIIGCNSQSQESATKTSATSKSSAPIDKTQVTWEPTLEAAFAKAKEENKPVFVECYLPTCPVCQSMEPFFKNPEVAEKYNTDFVNFKLDASNKDLVKFLDSKKIYLPSFPIFLFFDADGNLIHKDEATTSVESFNAVADRAMNPETRSGNYAKRFADGDRSLPFLIEYASFCRIVRDTVTNVQVANAIYDAYPKDKLGTEESWRITKKDVTDIDNGFAKYWFDHVPMAKEYEKKEGHPESGVENILGGIIQSSLYGRNGKTYNSAKLQQIRNYMTKIGAGQYADGVTWEFDVRALIREGKPAQALAIGNKMAGIYGSSGQSLVYITRVFNDVYPDKSYVPTAKNWLTKAKPQLKEPKDLAEYYLESARLNQRNGDIAAAKADAQQAQSFAVQAKIPLDRFSALSNSL